MSDQSEIVHQPQAAGPEEEKKKKFSRSSSSFSLRWLNKQMRAALSIVVMVLVVGLVLMIISFFFKELTDEGYIIEQVNVPSSLVDAGFSGPLIANRISYQLQEIMDITRQQEYSKAYSSSDSDMDLSIELIGIGVPVRGIIDLIGDAVGVNRRKRIKADVYFAGSKVVMILKLSGEKPEYLETDNNPNADVPMKILITKAAEKILKYTDDSSLQRYYLGYKMDGEESIQLAKYRLEKYAGNTHQEAMILSDWAFGLVRMKNFDAAFSKIIEGLKKDSTVAQLYLTRGTWYLLQAQPDRALPDYKRTLKLLTSQDRKMDWLRTYINLGNIYNLKKNADSAFHYYDKVLAIDPRFNIAYWNKGIIYLQVKQDTASFLEFMDKALSYGLNPANMDLDPDLEGVRKLKAFQDIRKKYVEN